jgi:hypothetical protein
MGRKMPIEGSKEQEDEKKETKEKWRNTSKQGREVKETGGK